MADGRFVQDVIKAPLLSALLLILPQLIVIHTGIFDNVVTELGFESYAEKPIYDIMPGNLIVNLGYLAIGVYWLRYYGNLAPKALSLRTVLSGSVFSWLSVIYTFIQSYRILYQSQDSAVLDQWITLTIFCHVGTWVAGIDDSECYNLLCYTASFLSYFLALLTPIGFELALALHVVLVIVLACKAQGQYGDSESRAVFIKALVCCAGFVVLKVLDLPLADYWTPNVLSGHLLSKVCDVGQIFFVVELVNRWDKATKAE